MPLTVIQGSAFAQQKNDWATVQREVQLIVEGKAIV